MFMPDPRRLESNQRAAGLLEQRATEGDLADRVEMVLRPLGDDTYRAAAVDGAAVFRRFVD